MSQSEFCEKKARANVAYALLTENLRFGMRTWPDAFVRIASPFWREQRLLSLRRNAAIQVKLSFSTIPSPQKSRAGRIDELIAGGCE